MTITERRPERREEGSAPTHKVRFVTATTLFDGHDASINIFRRILQASGAEVVHLGHNRSGLEIVETAIQEDAQGIAVTSYQGGHMEFFRYLHDLLGERECSHIRLFGGGGGTILPEEAQELEAYGICRIYTPDDGRTMGLQGMVEDMLGLSDFPTGELDGADISKLAVENKRLTARLISAAENYPEKYLDLIEEITARAQAVSSPVVGVTGTGGSGKSSLVDELVRRYLLDFPDRTIAVVSVDPSRRRSGGALLGDRIRMNSIVHPRAYMRSLATRRANLALSPHVQSAVAICRASGYDLVVLETSGIGQAGTEIVDHSDLSVYVMTPEYGAATQLEKTDMLDFADLVAINKADKEGALDALRDVRKQVRRNRLQFEGIDEELPVHLTIASQFNDPGTNRLYRAVMGAIGEKTGADFTSHLDLPVGPTDRQHVVPPERARYLAEIVAEIRRYDAWADEQAEVADRLYRLRGAAGELGDPEGDGVDGALHQLQEAIEELDRRLDGENRRMLEEWEARTERYRADDYTYQVRGRRITVPLYHETLSHTRIPKVALPRYRG
ncbi:MAG: cobalamin-dependent protein, partial [Acidimicrobiia bacterium]